MAETQSSSRRIQFGFKLGLFVANTGIILRIAASHVSSGSIGDVIWSKSDDLQQALVDISIAVIAFAVVAFAMTLNRWLWASES